MSRSFALVDLHVHLLAGLDDGPRDPEQALEMCRMLAGQGVTHAVALAHQNDTWPDNSAERIRASVELLRGRLEAAAIPLAVYPTAEVTVHPDLDKSLDEGRALTVADRGGYILLELPRDQLVYLGPILDDLKSRHVRPIIAHAERCEELLHDPDKAEDVVRRGCLLQVSTLPIAQPKSARDEAALKDWVVRGLAHVIGSDGHSTRRRPPLLADAADKIVKWVGAARAEELCYAHGKAILDGSPLVVRPPEKRSRGWFGRLIG